MGGDAPVMELVLNTIIRMLLLIFDMACNMVHLWAVAGDDRAGDGPTGATRLSHPGRRHMRKSANILTPRKNWQPWLRVKSRCQPAAAGEDANLAESSSWRRETSLLIGVSETTIRALHGGTIWDCLSLRRIGMKPAAFIDNFSPFCSSACVQNTHQTPCGFDCAKGVGTCVQTIMGQVSVVARSDGSVANYSSGDLATSAVVDQVLRLASFFIDVVLKVVKVAKHVFSDWPRGEATLGVVIVLVQFVLDHATTIGQDFLQLNEMFGETVEMVLDFIDGVFDWKDINLRFISDTVLKHGTAILGGAGDLADVLMFPQYKVVSDTNRDYECDGNGDTDCRDWSFRSIGCRCRGTHVRQVRKAREDRSALTG